MSKLSNSGIALCLTVLFLSCSSLEDEPATCDYKANSSDFSMTLRTVDDAIKIAMDAKSMISSSSNSRVQDSRDVDFVNGIKCVISCRGRGVADTLMYVVNYCNDQGFALIPCNTNLDPLLAVTESGHYYPSEDCTNPGLSYFMDLATEYVQNPKRVIRPGENYEEIRRVYVNGDTVLPRLSVQWGQRGIYGQYCPNSIAGCNNTAVAMVMSYFEFPSRMKLSYMGSSSDYILNWANIKCHKSGTVEDNCSAQSPHSDIAHIMREIGYRSGSVYESGATSTSPSSTRQTMKDFGFDVSGFKDYSELCIRKNIGDGIVIMSGYNEAGGHTWVVDGYKYKHTLVVDYIKREGEFLEQEVSSYNYDEMFNHIDWGWNGLHNGYFNDGVFATSSGDFSGNVIYFTVNI